MKSCRHFASLVAILVLAVVPACFAGEPARLIRFDRLEKLADRIEQLPPGGLNMQRWGRDGDPNPYCAGGHAADLFASDGFRRIMTTPREYLFVEYRGKTAYAACAEFFGMEEREASDLFSQRNGHDPKVIAARIRAVARRGRAQLVLAAIR